MTQDTTPADRTPDQPVPSPEHGPDAAEPTGTAPGHPKRRQGVWTRNFTLYIGGLALSNVGTWIQRVAQSWLILEMTGGDATALGLTTVLQFSPVLLIGAWGGVIVDRFPKRGLVLVTQVGMGLLALALGLVTMMGVVAVWHVYLLALLLGVFNVFDNPGRNAMLNEIVPPAVLPRAIGLQSACTSVARMLGPSIGGVLLATTGPAMAFYLNAASYLAVVISLMLMRGDQYSAAPLSPRKRGQVREGWRYVARRHDLLLPMIVIAFVNTFAMNFQMTIALLSREALSLPASAYGLLFGAVGAGAIAGALLAAARARPRMSIMLGAAAALGCLEITAGLVTNVWLLTAVFFCIGIASLSVSNSSNTIVQLGAAPQVRGRVLSLYFLAVSGARPVGAYTLGLVASALGPEWPMIVGGLVSMLVAAAACVAWARLNR